MLVPISTQQTKLSHSPSCLIPTISDIKYISLSRESFSAFFSPLMMTSSRSVSPDEPNPTTNRDANSCQKDVLAALHAVN